MTIYADMRRYAKTLREVADNLEAIAAAHEATEKLVAKAKAAKAPVTLRQSVVHFMKPGWTYKAKQISEAMNKRGDSAMSGGSILTAMVKDGEIKRVGRGQYTLP